MTSLDVGMQSDESGSCGFVPDFIVPESDFSSMPDWTEALLAVGNIIVLVLAICGNIGALLILYKSEVSRKSTKLYLASLALCDLLLAIFSPPVDISQLLSRYRSWIFGAFLCRFIPFVQVTVVTGAALFLVAIAVERYLFVVRALRLPHPSARTTWDKISGYVITSGIWLFCTGIAIPNFWYYNLHSFWTFLYQDENGDFVRPRNETCKTYYTCMRTQFDEFNTAYYAFLGVGFAAPTLAFLFCYISILVFVKKHVESVGSTLNHANITTEASTSRISKSRKTLWLILALILINLLCRIPIWCFIVTTNVKEVPVNSLTLILMYGFHLLSNVNSVINPFVYAIFNDSIRSTRGLGGGTGLQDAVRVGNNEYNFEGSGTERNNLYQKIKALLGLGEDRKMYDFTQSGTGGKCIVTVSTQRISPSERND